MASYQVDPDEHEELLHTLRLIGAAICQCLGAERAEPDWFKTDERKEAEAIDASPDQLVTMLGACYPSRNE